MRRLGYIQPQESIAYTKRISVRSISICISISIFHCISKFSYNKIETAHSTTRISRTFRHYMCFVQRYTEKNIYNKYTCMDENKRGKE